MAVGRKRRIRVASVYAPSPWNPQWLALQTDFLRRTENADIEFSVFLNGTELDTSASGAGVIARSPGNGGHAFALRAILESWRNAGAGADGYLLLDSDAFPVHPGWLDDLTSLMARHGKSFAAPVRAENLETYPHPCALYFDGAALQDPRLLFDEGASAINMLGCPVRDVGAGLLSLQPDLLPLLRSNARNPHPIAAAIYSGVFYHHGAGSRSFSFRAIDKFGYYASGIGLQADPADLTNALIADPEGFIKGLQEP